MQAFLFATVGIYLSTAAAVQPQTHVGLYKTSPLMAHVALEKLKGHVPPAVDTSKQTVRYTPDASLTISFALEPNNEAELEALVSQLYDANSTQFHQFLKPEEYRARFAPSAAQFAQTQSMLAAHGFSNLKAHGNLLQASGKIRDIETFLNTEIYNFEKDDGTPFFAPSYELQLPASSGIRAVHGLNNASPPHHHLVRPDANAAASGRLVSYDAAAIRKVYNIPANLDGSGQTLALLEMDGYQLSDIETYARDNGIRRTPLLNIYLDGYNGAAGPGADEVTLDIEVMMALSPNAKQIRVYEAPNGAWGNMIDVWNEMANPSVAGTDLAMFISCSWGTPEADLTAADRSTDYNLFRQMAAQGQTMFAAAGDSGAYDDGQNLGVDEPAAQPYVVGVGGTTLYSVNDNYDHEVTWGGGGGGISRYWRTPSWQAGAITADAAGSKTNRNVPDVSLNADPYSGYSIYTGGAWTAIGGTSCAAPLWAAFAALVNQQRMTVGVGPLGFMTPALYSTANGPGYSAAFHDIADGSTNGYYPATKGFDNATGWGSFNGQKLLNKLTFTK